MKQYNDTYELYQSVLDEVHAPDDLTKRIKDMDTTHKKNNKMKWIPAAAACLAVVLVVTFIIGGFSVRGNSFVLKANAAEIGGESYVEIAKVAPVGGGSGSVVEQDKTIQNYSAVIPFSIKCDGRNIKSIKYSVQNAVFLFPYDSYASGFREQYTNQASAYPIKSPIKPRAAIKSKAILKRISSMQATRFRLMTKFTRSLRIWMKWINSRSRCWLRSPQRMTSVKKQRLPSSIYIPRAPLQTKAT